MKYRILEITHPKKKTKYKLQYKNWLGLWKYESVYRSPDFCYEGWEEPRVFNSTKEIEEYLIKQQPDKVKIIRELSL